MDIRFEGQVYASVEAMPSAVRQRYLDSGMGDPELAELLALEADEHPDAESVKTLPRAWGGAAAAGGVPVPAGFESVVELGPATAAFQAAPGLHLPHLGPPHASALVVYREGFAFQAGGKTVQSWRFDDVGTIQSNLAWPPHSAETHEFTLTRTGGESLILDDGLKGVVGAADRIKKLVFAHLAPGLMARYQAGETLAFGSVTVQAQTGLRMSGRTYAWDTIRNIEVESGRFRLELKDGKRPEVRASSIPNIELLGQLIGLPAVQMQLTYI